MRKPLSHSDDRDEMSSVAEIDTPHWLQIDPEEVVSFELLSRDSEPARLAESDVPPEFLNIL